MTGQKRYKRTHYIVEKNIQFRFVGLLLFYMALFFLIAAAVVYLSGWQKLIEKMANVYPQAVLLSILNNIYIRIFAGFLLLLPVAVISAILVSHKIAGPLVRIKWALRQMTEGNYNFTIKLRPRDQLKDVAYLINKLAESLKKKNVPK